MFGTNITDLLDPDCDPLAKAEDLTTLVPAILSTVASVMIAGRLKDMKLSRSGSNTRSRIAFPVVYVTKLLGSRPSSSITPFADTKPAKVKFPRPDASAVICEPL